MSLPDESLLHQTSGVLQEPGERQSSCTPELDDSQAAKDDIDDEESEVDEEDDCDFEEFTAKKSVSFSEKIFYHSTSVATSPPLDSCKCSQVETDSPPQTTSTSLTMSKRSVQCKSLGIGKSCNESNFIE